MNAWVIHRNVDIFGADANDFNPDRWLDSDAAANMDKYMLRLGEGQGLVLVGTLRWRR